MEEQAEQNQKQEQKSTLERLHTYKSDVARSIKGGKQSLVGMVIAEKKRGERPDAMGTQTENKKIFTKKNIFIGIGALFILLTLGIVVFLASSIKKEEVAAPSISAWSPIFTEVDKKIIWEQFDDLDIRSAVTVTKNSTAIPINGVLGITFVQIIETELGTQETAVTARELFEALPNDIPPQLSRTVDQEFFFGMHSFRAVAPFLILRNNFYDGAFLGMLEWERFMLHDLAPLFLLNQNIAAERFFEDIVINNIDVRVLKNAQGEIIFLYSFVDRKTVLLTTNADTFAEIVSRLRTAPSVTR